MAELLLKKNTIRAVIYRILYNCYYSPDYSLINSLGRLEGTVKDFFSRVIKSLPEPSKLEELRVDYARLFLGPYKALASPYGSIYIDGNDRVMDSSTTKVRDYFRSMGVGLASKEIPDHLAVELEFMHFLCVKELQALEDSDSESAKRYLKDQHDFLKTYIASWVFSLTGKIVTSARTEFYKEIALATESFIQKEIKELTAAGLTQEV